MDAACFAMRSGTRENPLTSTLSIVEASKHASLGREYTCANESRLMGTLHRRHPLTNSRSLHLRERAHDVAHSLLHQRQCAAQQVELVLGESLCAAAVGGGRRELALHLPERHHFFARGQRLLLWNQPGKGDGRERWGTWLKAVGNQRYLCLGKPVSAICVEIHLSRAAPMGHESGDVSSMSSRTSGASDA